MPPIAARRSRVPIIAGLVAGGVVVLGGILLVGSLAADWAPAAPSSPPTAVPSRTAVPTAKLPSGVTTGLLEVAAVNERLASAADEIDAALQARRPSAGVIGQQLRTIAASARSGLAAAQRVAAWPAAGSFAQEVAAFYRAIAEAAAEGLADPLRDNDAYATSGRRMHELLTSLPEVTAATRAAAARAGVTLPTPTEAPTTLPEPSGGG